ncbi:hypothetical protein CBS101457_004991 [Exobasidium rhododendri]|nr:hypothetical protein CBS101457_004991 [Exobasidium rhododendri]
MHSHDLSFQEDENKGLTELSMENDDDFINTTLSHESSIWSRVRHYYRDSMLQSNPYQSLKLKTADEGRSTGHSKRRPSRRSKWCLAVLCIPVLVILVQILSRKSVVTSSAMTFDESYSKGDYKEAMLSIQQHIEEAKRTFEQLQSRQSRSVAEAVHAYKTRYGRDVPALFEEWAQYALERGSVIMDDYDQIEASLLPFRSMTPHQLKMRMEDVKLMERDDKRVGTLSIRDTKTYLTGPGDLVWHMNNVLTHLDGATHLPNLSVLVNFMDEPKVIARPDARDYSGDTVNLYRYSEKDAFDAMTQACPASYVSQSTQSSDRPSTDLCTLKARGSRIEQQHAYLRRPDAAYNKLVPILSIAKFSTHGDILMPAYCYGGDAYRAKEEHPLSYLEKKPSLYWRGSSTGFVPTKDNWRYGHRQRLIKFARKAAQSLFSVSVNAPMLEESGIGEPVQVNSNTLHGLHKLDNSMFNMSFTNIIYCDDKNKDACDEMKAALPVSSYTSSSTAFTHRYLIDMDGNSMSCRFYRLLGTDSLVFKQTLYGEWHDDRIIPWYHYIPVSMDLGDLPVLLDYFNNNEQGKRDGQRIAKQGREWVSKALRTEDVVIYFYRLLVEYASLF